MDGRGLLEGVPKDCSGREGMVVVVVVLVAQRSGEAVLVGRFGVRGGVAGNLETKVNGDVDTPRESLLTNVLPGSGVIGAWKTLTRVAAGGDAGTGLEDLEVSLLNSFISASYCFALSFATPKATFAVVSSSFNLSNVLSLLARSASLASRAWRNGLIREEKSCPISISASSRSFSTSRRRV